MSPFRPDLVDVWMFRPCTRSAGAAAAAGVAGVAGVAGAAGSAGAVTDPEILLMRRSPGRILPGLWQCVSGSLEADETVTAGALRELREETGFDPGQIVGFYDLDQVNQFHEPSVRGIVSAAVFAVRLVAGAEPTLSHEHDGLRWVSPDEALDLAVWPAYRESIRRIVENLLDPERAIWFELTLAGDRARR
ncbi:MAG: NUDIX domain-containing protein [Candidatus Limnocylindrales bacterium]